MLKKLLPLAVLALIFTNCVKEDITTLESNKAEMNKLVIQDPAVWNTMVNRAIQIDTEDGGMKALTAYPSKGYYYAIFEDLYPSQGDYDFNDIMLETKLYLESKKGEINGRLNTTFFHKGGSLNTKLGLMFYSLSGSKSFTVISNDLISINGVSVSESFGASPFTMELPAAGSNFDVEFLIDNSSRNVNQIWIAWFILSEQNGVFTEIHTSGFAPSNVKSFELPQTNYLTVNNLPWGLEIEAEKFYIPKERALFIDVFPEFKVWAESNGEKNKTWFQNPDLSLVQ